MATPADTLIRKVHASLNVTKLSRSVTFYRCLLGAEPAKHQPDYAKFEIDDPPLVLSLIPGVVPPGGNLNHIGLRLRSAEELVAVQHRLEASGIRTLCEDGVECCYAKQTKFWVTDPDRALWEIYILHDDLEEHGHGIVPTSTQVESFAKNIPRPNVTWRHQLGDQPALPIPHADNSVNEVHFEGTANAAPEEISFGALLADVHRILRPGGTLTLHGLASDTSLPPVILELPGPAAAVKYVPSTDELVSKLKGAGFANVRFEKLSERAYFEISKIALREAVIVSQKPGHRSRSKFHAAVYLGPLATVTDDFGNNFPKGVKTPLCLHDWLTLKNGPASSDFLLLVT